MKSTVKSVLVYSINDGAKLRFIAKVSISRNI